MRFERGHCEVRMSNIGLCGLDRVKVVYVDCDLSRTPVDRNRVVALFLVGLTLESENATFLNRFLRFERAYSGLDISNIGGATSGRVQGVCGVQCQYAT